MWQGTWENLWKTQINTDDIESDWMPKVQKHLNLLLLTGAPARHPSLKSWRHQWESLTELLLSMKNLPELKLFSTLCVIIWKYCGVNKLIIHTRHLSHRWIKISWNESLNITGSQIGDVTVQPAFSDITADRDVFLLFALTFSPGRPRPQNEEYLGVSSSSECRRHSVDWGCCSLWTWRGSPVNATPMSWPTWWQMAPAAYEHLKAPRSSSYVKNVALTVMRWDLSCSCAW